MSKIKQASHENSVWNQNWFPRIGSKLFVSWGCLHFINSESTRLKALQFPYF